jgi:uncharacterized protein (DUF1778 family)
MVGRPTKEPGEKMDVPLRIMLTASQDALIRQAAQSEGADISPWARNILLRAAQARIDSERKRKK